MSSPNKKVSSLFRRAITLQHSVVKIKSEFDSLRKGFELFGLIKMMEQHPLLLKSLFVAGSTDFEVCLYCIVIDTNKIYAT